MDTARRRAAMLERLLVRRQDSVAALAEAFDVSRRTVRRDLAYLSETEALYTQCGRHGGVYVLGEPRHACYLSGRERALVGKLCRRANAEEADDWSEGERELLALLTARFCHEEMASERKPF